MPRKRIYSGVCLCGHKVESHHLACIVKQEVIDLIGECVVPGSCLWFGCNEDEGVDEDGNDHCWSFVDAEDVDEEVKAQWRGTKR
jgi:hypothetical protein